MKKGWVFGLIGILFSLVASAQTPPPRSSATFNLPASAPNVRFTTTNAFGTLRFTSPVALATPPGETNRLFVVEQAGRIIVITNLAQPTKTTFLDIAARTVAGGEQGLLGLAFHPGFATNGFFFVFYTRTATTTAGSGLHDRLSRFTLSTNNQNAGDPASEVPLFSQFDQAGNHNGGDLHFGPDGYLYISLGDEGGANDQYNNSQRIDKDFFASIARIDVDMKEGNLPPNAHASVHTPHQYLVPADNPFVGATNFNGLAVDPTRVRTEFWATGMRNPWRMSFDRGTLYVGDVGQNAREEIDIVVRGGNYGWAFREGLIAGPKAAPAGVTAIAPIHDYPRSQGLSVTGGLVYRGRRLGELRGKYIFTDYGSGRIWAGTLDGTNRMTVAEIATDVGISAFGTDPSTGDVLTCDLAEGQIKRLGYSAETGNAPATLADTRFFSNTETLSPTAGSLPYDVNLSYWTDGLEKRRWFSIPDTNTFIQPNGTNWQFPAGSTWVQHFDIETTNGVPESRRPVETRVLVKTSDGAYGLTYRWTAGATNATLVPPGGMDEEIQISSNGTTRSLAWRYPARSECLRCHSAAPGWAIGFQPWQLNRESSLSGAHGHQIESLAAMGYFGAAPTNVHLTKFPVAPTNEAWSVEHRARSWIAVNCAHCHRPGGNGAGSFDARLELTTDETGMIGGALRAPLADRRIIVPGSVERSELYQRLVIEGPGHMPPLDSKIPDPHALPVIAYWITNDLPARPNFAAWQTTHFGSTQSADASRTSDPDADNAVNYLEFLTATNPTNALERWELSIAATNGARVEISFPQIANRLFELQRKFSLTNTEWMPVDLSENRPFVRSTNVTGSIVLPAANQMEFYRVRVSEP